MRRTWRVSRSLSRWQAIGRGHAPFAPKKIDGHSRRHNHQTGPGRLRAIPEQYAHDYSGAKDVQGRDDRISKGSVRPLGQGTGAPQAEDPQDGQDVEDQRRRNDVIEQVLVETAIS